MQLWMGHPTKDSIPRNITSSGLTFAAFYTSPPQNGERSVKGVKLQRLQLWGPVAYTTCIPVIFLQDSFNAHGNPSKFQCTVGVQ